MASIEDAYAAIMRRLQTMPDRPNIVYDDDPQGAELPRIIVSYVGPSQRTIGLDGATDGAAEISARIETAEGDYAVQAGQILAAVQAHFRASTKFDGVTMMETPRPSARYNSGGVYHVPVQIRGRYFF